MNLRDRIGIDLNRNVRIEDGVAWAAKNGVRHLDIQLDSAANAITSFAGGENYGLEVCSMANIFSF